MKKENCPKDFPFYQQSSATYFTDFSGYQIAILLTCIGILFTPLGSVFKRDQKSVYEQLYTYDSSSTSSCHISSRNQRRQCQITFTLTADVNYDLYVYYQLSNYYQNHRRYIDSLSITQLQGQNLGESGVSLDCDPLLYNGTRLLNPCGLVANSFFNDVFSINPLLSSSQYYLDESDISLESDRDKMFKQVSGFQYQQINSLTETCADSGLPEGCQQYCDPSTFTCYNFYYPDSSTVQYLYETYPGIISPIDGVTDEHFIVWMRTSSLPNFRKLYGKIEGPFNEGDTIVFDVLANFEVTSFGGTKSLLLSSLGSFGGKNQFIGEMFLTSGIIFIVFGGIVALWETWVIRMIKKPL